MAVKISLVLLLCGLACASAYYIALDDDYYNRNYRVASYGFGAPATYGRFQGGYPSYRRYRVVPQTVNYGYGAYWEDINKKKK